MKRKRPRDVESLTATLNQQVEALTAEILKRATASEQNCECGNTEHDHVGGCFVGPTNVWFDEDMNVWLLCETCAVKCAGLVLNQEAV